MRKRRRQEECGWERGKREGIKVENVGGSGGGGGRGQARAAGQAYRKVTKARTYLCISAGTTKVN